MSVTPQNTFIWLKGDNDLLVFFNKNYFSSWYIFNIIIYSSRKITDNLL